MMILSWVLAFAAWALLYMAMDRPYRELFKLRKIKPRQGLMKDLSIILLVCSLWCSVEHWGYTVGFAAWWVLLTVSAFSFTMLRTYLPSHIFLFTGITVVLGGVGSLIS